MDGMKEHKNISFYPNSDDVIFEDGAKVNIS